MKCSTKSAVNQLQKKKIEWILKGHSLHSKKYLEKYIITNYKSFEISYAKTVRITEQECNKVETKRIFKTCNFLTLLIINGEENVCAPKILHSAMISTFKLRF